MTPGALQSWKRTYRAHIRWSEFRCLVFRDLSQEQCILWGPKENGSHIWYTTLSLATDQHMGTANHSLGLTGNAAHQRVMVFFQNTGLFRGTCCKTHQQHCRIEHYISALIHCSIIVMSTVLAVCFPSPPPNRFKESSRSPAYGTLS